MKTPQEKAVEEAYEKRKAQQWIFVAAIEKAKKNGFVPERIPPLYSEPYIKDGGGVGVRGIWATETLIFDHDFAKAFWGEIDVTSQRMKPKRVENYSKYKPLPKPNESEIEYEVTRKPAWQFYLQELVLAEDRLAYLEKFL
jgi:hypothetical protein